jgi:pyruvate formate lyase activating enzyme
VNTGLIGNIQRYSLHDGPGIRTTVFLKGCPLKCAWCHNPENISPNPELVRFESRCLHCGLCVDVCPERPKTDASAPFASNLPVPRDRCRLCGACVEACPTGAREIIGRQATVQEIVAALAADRIFYEDSGGGVTFSGGEPLLQYEFLRALLEACQARGFHTAVDTCGFTSPDRLLNIAAHVNLFLYDLKFIDNARHLEFCGAPNQPILDNLQALGRAHKNIWVRIPVIPGINDEPRELEHMARFITGVPGVRQVNLLPYHPIGLHKFPRLGKPYSLNHIVPPSAEYLEAVVARFRAFGLDARAGG